MVLVFFSIIVVVLVASRNVLSVVLLMELLGFVVLYFLGIGFVSAMSVDFFIMAVFSVLVMEGVLSLCGLIMLVSFSGSDYLSSGSFVKL